MGFLALLSKKESSGSSGEWSNNGGSTGGYEVNDKGLVGSYIQKSLDGIDKKMKDSLENSIDKVGNKIGDKISSKISEYTTYLVSDLISIIEMGAICYGFYHCIVMMFFSNKVSNKGVKPMDKIAFSYFVFFILRILNTVVKVRGGIIAK